MSRGQRASLVAIAVVIVAVGAGIAAYAVASGGNEQPAARASATSSPTNPPVEVTAPARPPRVAELMTRAGCRGSVIGTQLYSRETGRCMFHGHEVTIAAFATNVLRDQWVDFGRQLGAVMVEGELWAAAVDGPDQALQLADVLGGRRL